MKTIILILLMSVSVGAFAENTDSYKASNGKTYQIGDTIKLGRGSAPNGNFLYLQMGGWGMMASARTDGKNDFTMPSSYSGLNVILKKIKQQKFKGAIKTIFVVGGGNITNYNLIIEDAIASCEIVDCKEKVQKVEMVNQNSKLDEIKKLKGLLDSGAITKEEFEAEKKKLLEK